MHRSPWMRGLATEYQFQPWPAIIHMEFAPSLWGIERGRRYQYSPTKKSPVRVYCVSTFTARSPVRSDFHLFHTSPPLISSPYNKQTSDDGSDVGITVGCVSLHVVLSQQTLQFRRGFHLGPPIWRQLYGSCALRALSSDWVGLSPFARP